MAKSKRGPALFEKLERTEGPSRGPRRSHSRPTSSPAATRETESVRGRHEMPEEPDEVPGRVSEPLVSFDGDHLRFSFTSGYAAVGIFLAVGCLAGAYWLGGEYGRRQGTVDGYERGRASYRAEVADEITAARQQDPATRLVDDLADAANASASDPAESGISRPQADAWVSGLTYVIVQEFAAANSIHAETAQRFLADRGIETMAVGLASGGTQLVTKQGYNRRDATQRQLADEFLEKVHETGKSYYASGGGYRLEGYFKLRRDRW